MSSDEYKKRIEGAIKEYELRQEKKRKKQEISKTYGSPEADFVKEFLGWIKEHKDFFSLNVIEAKGVYDPFAGRYSTGQVEPGYPDISGNDASGIAMYLEAKAPGKRSNISLGQYMFLKRKIEMNCFAVCFDSIEYFKTTYKKWSSIEDKSERIRYLTSELPVNKKILSVINAEDPF